MRITLPQLLARNAERMPDRPALREKDRGIWQTYSWRRYCDEVRDFALGLAARGFGRGDKLSVIGENRPRLYFAQLAAMSLGGIAVPVYQDAIASELAYVLAHAETSVVVAEDQEQVDKILSLRDELPHLKLLVYDDPRGLRNYDEPLLASFEDVQAGGAALRAPPIPDFFAAALDDGRSGRSGAVLLHLGHDLAPERGDAVARQSDQRRRGLRDSRGHPPRRRAPVLSADGMDRQFAVLAGAASAGRVHLQFSGAAGDRNARLARTRSDAGARAAALLGNTLTAVTVRAADSAWLKRSLFEHFRGVAERVQMLRGRGQAGPAGLRLRRALGEALVYAPLRDQLGLRRARLVYTGGAPLGPDTFRFFRAVGVNLKQVYGASELAGVCSAQPDGEVDPETVGRVFPGIEVRIADSGEVLARSGGVFRGYYKQPEESRAALTEDGWLQDRRCRLYRPARPSGHRRSGERCRQAGGRHGARPAIHREQAQVQPVYRRGGGVRRRAGVCRGDCRDRRRPRSATGPSGTTWPIPRSRISRRGERCAG